MNKDTVWDRIVRYSGETFHQKLGKPFTYEASGRTLRLHTTNRMISRSAMDNALDRVPFASTTDCQGLQAPSYIFGILMDPRIRRDEW